MQKLSQKETLKESILGALQYKVYQGAKLISPTARADAERRLANMGLGIGDAPKDTKKSTEDTPDDDPAVEAVIQYWKKQGSDVKINKKHEPNDKGIRRIDFKILKQNRNGHALLRADNTIADIRPRA